MYRTLLTCGILYISGASCDYLCMPTCLFCWHLLPFYVYLIVTLASPSCLTLCCLSRYLWWNATGSNVILGFHFSAQHCEMYMYIAILAQCLSCITILAQCLSCITILAQCHICITILAQCHICIAILAKFSLLSKWSICLFVRFSRP